MSKIIRKFSILRAVALALALLAASLAVFAPGRAKACPTPYGYEWWIFYYSDDTYSQNVGMCQGDSCTGWEYCDGVRTEFYRTSTITIQCC